MILLQLKKPLGYLDEYALVTDNFEYIEGIQSISIDIDAMNTRKINVSLSIDDKSCTFETTDKSLTDWINWQKIKKL